MRLFAIVLVVLGIVFLGIVGFVDSSIPAPPEGQEDEYEPSALTSLIGNLALRYPGATYVLPGPNPFTVGPVIRRLEIQIESIGTNETRLVKLALVAGPFARVTYDCGANCSKSLCLVARGDPPPGCSGKLRDTGGIPLDPSGGTIRIEAWPPQAPQTATIESR